MSFLKHHGGHYPGHLRDLFLEAIDAFRDWNEGKPEPTIELEPYYEFESATADGAAERNARKKPHIFTVSEVCGLLWNCTDILSGTSCSSLEWCSIELKSRTYAAATRAMLETIRTR